MLTLDDVDRLLAGENVLSSQSYTRIPVINYVQGGNGGFFKDGDQPFPNNGVDNFALEIRGTMQINTAGTYTFRVSSNARHAWRSTAPFCSPTRSVTVPTKSVS